MSEHICREARLDDAIRNLVRIAREDQEERRTESILLGDLIRREREGWNMSLRELAKRSGVNKAMLSRLENHANLDPRVSELSALAEALEFPPSRLFQAALDSRRVMEAGND